MKEFRICGENIGSYKSYGSKKHNFLRKYFGSKIKDYELMASLKDAEKNHGGRLKWNKNNGGYVKVNIEEFHNFQDMDLWLMNY
jgi:hypothetical protein